MIASAALRQMEHSDVRQWVRNDQRYVVLSLHLERRMSRVISPPLNQIASLQPPLTAGEALVLKFFDTNLPEGWEIYIQPHLNGLRPDFVLLHPKQGIAVFEVKDWNLDAMHYWFEEHDDDDPKLWARSPDGVVHRRDDDPLEKVLRYKDQILNLYCPRLGIRAADESNLPAVITAGVIMTKVSGKRARDFFAPSVRARNLLGAKAQYHPISGADELLHDNLGAVFPWAGRSSVLMRDEYAHDLRSWLIEPDHAASRREPLELDQRQRAIVRTPPDTASGYRRIKGPAGSGKSLVLAARAAHLSAEGKRVLVVSYNITLWHYLRDLAKRYPTPMEARTLGITWVHFHEWCKRVCSEAGMEGEYRALWRRDGDSDDSAIYDSDDSDAILEKSLPALVGRALNERGDRITTYDAVLVDEGQDFNLEWWNLLRRVCPGGEMMLVADETQDLYGRAKAWTDESMSGAGFQGRWATLGASYRLPSDLVPHLQEYARRYLQDTTVNLPEAIRLPATTRQLELRIEPVKLRWIQISPGAAVPTCVRAMLDTVKAADLDLVAISDITLLTNSHNIGVQCIDALQQNGINAAHVFELDKRRRKSRKLAFYIGDARVKGATIHSYKGWETRALVVYIDKSSTPEDRALLYVAMTRLKRHTQGSFLTVVCADEELESYGRTWPEFERVPSTAPRIVFGPRSSSRFSRTHE